MFSSLANGTYMRDESSDFLIFLPGIANISVFRLGLRINFCVLCVRETLIPCIVQSGGSIAVKQKFVEFRNDRIDFIQLTRVH